MEKNTKNFLKWKYYSYDCRDIFITMDFQWLQTQFDLNPDKTKAGLAKALGLEPPAISKILNGTRQIKAHEYHVMRQHFSLPVDGGRAVSNQSVLSPLHQDVKSTHLSEGSQDDSDQSWIIPDSILNGHTKTPPENIKTFTIQESLMEPDFRRGEPVLVDLSDVLPSPPGVFIIFDGYSYLIRQCEIITALKSTEVKISARDEEFKPQCLRLDQFKIIGRVIAKLQWL